LIINHLSIKTHETTGNKPAKLEMIKKPNMNKPHQPKRTEYNPQSLHNPTGKCMNQQKRMSLIINHLHPKTHETTGNKPAKLAINNNPS
jgi:hypothetical protein